MTHDPNRPTPHNTSEQHVDRAADDTKPWIDADESTSGQSDSAASSNGLPDEKHVSSSPTESFDAMAQLPNADIDQIGPMNRFGMPPRNNPSDTEYYETYQPDTVSNTPQPPAAQPSAMNKQAKEDADNYTQ